MSTPKMIRSGVANDMSRLKPTLQHCLEAALSIADSMIDEMLDRLDLIADPDRATPLPLQLDRIDQDLILQLIDEADAIKRSWNLHLRRYFFHGEGRDEEMSTTVRFDDLRLMDDDHIDASIEFAMVEQSLLKTTADLLPRLNALVSSLMGWMTVQPDLNPLKPSAYARALRAVIVEQVPDPEQRKLLFVPVASILGDSLRQVYRELIQWLMAHGVEPVDNGGGLNASQEGAPRGAVGKTLLTLGRLRQLLAGDLNAGESGGASFVHTVPLSLTAVEDMDLIEPLLQRLRQRSSPPPEQQALAELPVVQQGQSLGRLVGQEVVRLMLDNLTQDERLLPAIRQQIGQLEPALIRLSLVDPRFFSDKQHPARRLLESITQRSLAYTSQNDEGFSELLQSVRGAVRSLAKVEADEEVFARLLKRLRRRWEEDDARKNQRRAEAARALMHAEQRQMLAERLAAEFLQKMQDKDVPEFVSRFLTGPWAQALAESRLAQAMTDEGETLDEVADDLIWSVQPALIRRDVDRLGRLVPRLLARMRQGLQAIDYPLEPVGEFFDALVSLHEKAFDTPTLSADPVQEPVVQTAEAQETHDTQSPDVETHASGGGENFWIGGKEAQEAGFVEIETGPMALEGLSVVEFDLSTGAWIDLLVQGQWVRAQLTWTSPRGSLFMFISASGLAHSMTRRTLERLLSSDSLRIVSRGGVVEGALDAVAQQALRNTGEPSEFNDDPREDHF